jgi:hypothetical protein
MGSVQRYLGRLAATVGRDGEAAEHFERALVANTQLRAAIELAHTQVDYAGVLGSGPRSDSLIEAAAEAAARLGLPSVARRVAELRDSRRALPSPDS